MAVLHLFGPVSAFYRYWRISLADFIAAMLSFWVTIFVSAEIGIGCAAAWSVAWTMLRSAFVKPTIHANTEDRDYSLPVHTISTEKSSDNENDNSNRTEHSAMNIPHDIVIIHFNDSIFYPNAGRGKRSALEAIQLVYDKVTQGTTEDRERSWSVAAERRVERLRREQRIVLKDIQLTVVVWDFTAVPFVDVTAILALGELKEDIRLHCGKGVQLRIVGMNESVRDRFLRAKWKLSDIGGWSEEGADVVYPSMEQAVLDRNRGIVLETVAIDDEKKG
jgi:sodium-independent sulfate anion transporter 11